MNPDCNNVDNDAQSLCSEDTQKNVNLQEYQ